MSLVDLHVDDAVEPKTIAEGTEVQVRVVTGSLEVSANNNEYLLAVLEVPTEPTAKDFRHMMMLPDDEASEKRQNSSKWRIKEFLQAFGFSVDNIDPESWAGATSWATLRETESGDYGMQNSIRKFLGSAGAEPPQSGQ